MSAIFYVLLAMQDTIGFFKDLGVELVLEPTGKYFPSTNSGKTILDALLRKIRLTKEHHTFMRA